MPHKTLQRNQPKVSPARRGSRCRRRRPHHTTHLYLRLPSATHIGHARRERRGGDGVRQQSGLLVARLVVYPKVDVSASWLGHDRP